MLVSETIRHQQIFSTARVLALRFVGPSMQLVADSLLPNLIANGIAPKGQYE